MNDVEEKIFICPNCGGTFSRRLKLESNIMKCQRCKPKLDKGVTDCLPCAERRKLNAKKPNTN